MLAQFFAKECQLARVYAESKSDRGVTTLFEENLRTVGKLTPKEIEAARSLVASAQAQCEEAGKLAEMPFLLGSSRRAKEAGSLLAKMELPLRVTLGQARLDELSTTLVDALRQGMADPGKASAWLTHYLPALSGGGEFGGVLSGLTGAEVAAVVLLSKCALGANCSGDSMDRLHACAMALACTGASVEQAISERFGVRANELSALSTQFINEYKAGRLREAGLFK